MDSTFKDSINHELKIFQKGCTVADAYYVVRLTVMVMSVLNMYRGFFFCPYSLNNIV